MSIENSGTENSDTENSDGNSGSESGGLSTTAPRRNGQRLVWLTFVIAVAVVLIDQGSKWWAESALGDGQTIPVIGDFIRFVLVYNPGAAFSIGTEFTWVFTILAGIAVVVLAWFARRVTSLAWMIAIGLLLGGAATNLGDRLFREPGFGIGHVVDFIGYADFFIGNVADIAIFSGVVLILVRSLVGDRKERATTEEPFAGN